MQLDIKKECFIFYETNFLPLLPPLNPKILKGELFLSYDTLELKATLKCICIFLVTQSRLGCWNLLYRLQLHFRVVFTSGLIYILSKLVTYLLTWAFLKGLVLYIFCNKWFFVYIQDYTTTTRSSSIREILLHCQTAAFLN